VFMGASVVLLASVVFHGTSVVALGVSVVVFDAFEAFDALPQRSAKSPRDASCRSLSATACSARTAVATASAVIKGRIAYSLR
jgi:peroxiredoxin family protein